MRKTIFHIDMDAFFASCEQIKQPQLKNKPIVVAHKSRRSIVTTSSYEARQFGVKTAMPLYKAMTLCPQLIIVEPHFLLYRQTSFKIWNLIKKRFTKRLEVIGIDEAFLDVTQELIKYSSPVQMAEKIRKTIQKELGITCSIGISYTKFLAKMASKMQKPNNQTWLREEDLPVKLWPIPIEKMQGVGLATTKILKLSKQIQTIGDLINYDEKLLISDLGKIGLYLRTQALGMGDDFVDPYPQEIKSISHEVTLESPLTDWEELEDLLFNLAQNNLMRLLSRQMVAGGVGVSLRYYWNNFNHENFDKLQHLRRQSKQKTLSIPTNNFETLFSTLKECLEELYKFGKPVLLLSVNFYKLQRNNYFVQANFDDANSETPSATVNQLLWEINHHFKSQKVFYASHLVEKKKKNDRQKEDNEK